LKFVEGTFPILNCYREKAIAALDRHTHTHKTMNIPTSIGSGIPPGTPSHSSAPSSSNSSSPTSILALQVDRNPQDIDSTKKSEDGSSSSSSSLDSNCDEVLRKAAAFTASASAAANKKRGRRSVSFKKQEDDEEEDDSFDGSYGEVALHTDLEEGKSRRFDRSTQEEEQQEEEAQPTKSSIVFWLIFWLLNNVALTILNKATFSKFDFKYPFFLSFFHMMCNWAGGAIYFRFLSWYTARNPPLRDEEYHARHGYQRSKSVLLDNAHVSTLDYSGTIKTWAFSVIFSLNIAIGNVSLRYVSVNFNQVMRSLVPAVAILFGYCLGKATSTRRKVAVIPVVMGVAMACFGEMSITMIGFVFTGLCVVLAALKAVAAGEILSGSLKLHPIDLLYKMAPKAALQCLILSCLTGEVTSIASRWATELSPAASLWPTFGVVSTGIMSFSLNISSLVSNKLTSPLTLCIAANVKQVLMILLATAIFNTPVSFLNGSGIAVVLVGSGIYSYVSMQEKTGGGGGAAAAKKSSSGPPPEAFATKSSGTGDDDDTSVSSAEEGVALIDSRR